VKVAAFQPFAFYQPGNGAYLRAALIRVYNLEKDDYSVPLGIGVGHVIKHGKTLYNPFVEPTFSLFDRRPGQPDWHVFMGLKLQFLN